MPPGGQENVLEWLATELASLRVEIANLRAELAAERAAALEKASKLEEQTRLHASERAEAVEKIAKLEAEIRQLKKQLLGPKSEKIPTLDAELRQTDDEHADPAETQRKREENARARGRLPRREIRHHVPAADRICSDCSIQRLPKGWANDAPLIEYVGDAFEHQDHRLEVLACPECQHEVIAPAPLRVIEGGRYGPRFFAFLIVAKCGDSIPIYRLEKRFRRLGIPMARSTMNDLLHGAAKLIEPLYKRKLLLIRESDLVLADETSMRVQKRKKRGFVWTFTAPIFDGDGRTTKWIKAYKFSPDRSGDTPKEVLGGTKGFLLVDMYTGYNAVTKVDGRERGACNAHSRRGFYEALETAPEAARTALNFYLEAFRVEREAKKLGIAGMAAHLELREKKSRPIMERFKAWLVAEQPKHLPKGPMGTAISYALNHWDELTLYLTDARIPFDNNISESNLRVVALGRKNFLHFGNDEAGQNIAMLYSSVSSCEANGMNPIDYLEDVLIRMQTHPASRIDELLPHNWRRPTSGDDQGGPAGDGPPPASSGGNDGDIEPDPTTLSRGDNRTLETNISPAESCNDASHAADNKERDRSRTSEGRSDDEDRSATNFAVSGARLARESENALARDLDEAVDGDASLPIAAERVDVLTNTEVALDASLDAEPRMNRVNATSTKGQYVQVALVVAAVVMLGLIMQVNLRSSRTQFVLRALAEQTLRVRADHVVASHPPRTVRARDGPRARS